MLSVSIHFVILLFVMFIAIVIVPSAFIAIMSPPNMKPTVANLTEEGDK